MPKTRDNNKKPQDKNAKRFEKNNLAKENAQHGKKSFSKEVDHL